MVFDQLNAGLEPLLTPANASTILPKDALKTLLSKIDPELKMDVDVEEVGLVIYPSYCQM